MTLINIICLHYINCCGLFWNIEKCQQIMIYFKSCNSVTLFSLLVIIFA